MRNRLRKRTPPASLSKRAVLASLQTSPPDYRVALLTPKSPRHPHWSVSSRVPGTARTTTFPKTHHYARCSVKSHTAVYSSWYFPETNSDSVTQEKQPHSCSPPRRSMAALRRQESRVHRHISGDLRTMLKVGKPRPRGGDSDFLGRSDF